MKIKKEINKLVKKYKSVFAQEDKYKFGLMLHLGPATKQFEIISINTNDDKYDVGKV